MSRLCRSSLLSALCLLTCLTGEPAESNEISPEEVAAQINQAVSAKWQASATVPAESVSDAAYLRQVMLDLGGRIPTLAELEEFQSDAAPDKRKRLVESLLTSADFAFHQRNEVDLLLLARLTNNGEWRDYLLTATRENRPWDRLFQEVLLPEVHQPGNKGAATFLRERVRELDDLTNDTAVLFFGVNIGCAKCHDHPLVPDWKQEHYYGMASFFRRTYRTKQNFLAEKFDGNLNFKTVKGEEKPAQFMFLTGAAVEEPKVERSEEDRKKLAEAVKKAEQEDNAEIPQPEFSPRSELVKLALHDQDKHFLSRNIVNRTWARLLGRGLVNPLDQLHSGNSASHPELFDWLAADLEQHGYDLRRLIGGIVLSEPYALSSQVSEGDRPPADQFAIFEPRPLTPRQLALSLVVATSNPQQLPGLSKPEDWSRKREELENRSNHLSSRLAIPDEGFQISIEESLLFSNNDHIFNEYLRDSGDRLLGVLKQTDGTDPRIRTAFRAVLSREPGAQETAAITEYVAARSDRESSAWQQVLWALATTPEFRFNH